ncbi:hypothetical protein JW826_04440 [Candidatus Woesearchaeota archaeon]|nr:hypothetical protein [Candidatus Woesearchaeota archaeon]
MMKKLNKFAFNDIFGLMESLYARANTKGKHFFYDQAIYSLSNFATLFILARFMTTAEYGVFTLLNTMMLFILGFVVSLIGMPMQVFYHHLEDSEKSKYLSSMFILNLLLTIISLPFLVIFYFLFQNMGLGVAIFLIFPVTLIFYTTQEYYRRVAMLDMNTRGLILSDFISSFLRACVIALCVFAFYLDLSLVLIIYAVLLFLGSLTILTRIEKISLGTLKNHFIKNYTFGRWKVLEHFMYSLTTPIYLFVAAAYLGPELLGIYGSIEIFARFSNLVMTSSTNYSFTEGSKKLKKEGPAALYALLKKIYGRLIPFLLAGSLLVILFGNKLLELIYPNIVIGEYYLLLPLLMVRILLEYFNQPIKVFFSLINKPEIVFVAYLLSAIFSIIVAFLLIRAYGIYGIALGSMMTGLIVLLVLYYQYFKLKRQGWTAL